MNLFASGNAGRRGSSAAVACLMLIMIAASAATIPLFRASGSNTTSYMVQSGDSLFLIGQKVGVSWQSIAQANGIAPPYLIYVGEVLLIPASGGSSTTTNTACATTPSDPGFYYMVQQGDYLALIGSKFGVPWQTIALANNIQTPYLIYFGETLLIPAGASPSQTCSSSSSTKASTSLSSVTSTVESSIQYAVQNGDNLYSIGSRFNVPWQTIAQLNNILPPYVIYVGEVLMISITSTTTSSYSSSTTFTSMTTSSTTSSGGKKYVMLRFDDSLQDQWVNVLPILEKYGFKATFVTVAGSLTDNGISSNLTGPWENLSWQEIEWLYANGFQIVDHSMTHPDLTRQSLSGLNFQVVQSKLLFLEHGINYINEFDFALPYGSGWDNQTLLNYIYGAGFTHVYTAWDVPGILNYSVIQTTWVPIDAADNDLSLSQFITFAGTASGTSAVGFMFHHVDDHVSGTGYYVNVTSFANDMAYLNASGFTVIVPLQLPGY